MAAVHQALDPKAVVVWDDVIGGRQFDVTIRFKKGLYTYLTVIECKDLAAAVSVEKVEAFVTKSKGAGANLAVMASSSGFQSGAIDVAAQHHITLLTVADLPDIVPLFGASWGKDQLALHIRRLELRYADGTNTALPELAAGALQYYVSKMQIRYANELTPLEAIVGREVDKVGRDVPLNCYQDMTITLPRGATLVSPDEEYPTRLLNSIGLWVANVMARTLVGPVAYDPALMSADVAIENLTTGETKVVSRHGLALGTATCFEVGKFYEQPQNEYYYYCAEVNGSLAQISLIESFQHGGLVRTDLSVDVKFCSHYTEVSNPDVLARLKQRLANFLALKASQTRL